MLTHLSNLRREPRVTLNCTHYNRVGILCSLQKHRSVGE